MAKTNVITIRLSEHNIESLKVATEKLKLEVMYNLGFSYGNFLDEKSSVIRLIIELIAKSDPQLLRGLSEEFFKDRRNLFV